MTFVSFFPSVYKNTLNFFKEKRKEFPLSLFDEKGKMIVRNMTVDGILWKYVEIHVYRVRFYIVFSNYLFLGNEVSL